MRDEPRAYATTSTTAFRMTALPEGSAVSPICLMRCSALMLSIRFEPDLLRELAPRRHFLLHESGELVRRVTDRQRALAREALAHFRKLDDARDLLRELRQHGL